MPATPEIEQKLAEQQDAKKNGQPLSFGQARQDAQYRTPPRIVGSDAGELVDIETVFGQQCVALAAQLHAMLATLRQLQRARLRAFGGDADLRDLDEADLERQARAVLGSDGFIQRR